ncbi:hypothetical protein ACFFU1_16475 [Algibacter miyuki]|uniref:Lipoprotein n=2 Tax=Algibacter miyuki TaxID=1306933 RepID=A0ABV5H5B6_9FLAO
MTCYFSCKNEVKKEAPYFEGEITLSESRGLYGSLFKVHTTYTISENYIKREQKRGGVNTVFDNYAGIIIDLEKDSVVLYYSDKFSGEKNKHSTSITNYKTNEKYKTFPNSLPSPVDNTFNLLSKYNTTKQVKDSTEIKGFKSDYSLYNDDSGILKQEVFDTKAIKVKRELLEMVFRNIPSEVNFILASDLRTTISDINNDSIVNGEQSKAVDLFLRDVFQKKESHDKQETSNLKALAKNKWVKIGLNILKKSVDLNIHVTSGVSDLIGRKVLPSEFSLPSLDFIEISDIDDFIDQLPVEGGGDFDD